MKIVAISDTHNNRIQKLPEGDVLVHAGDLTALGRHGETQKMISWLKGYKDQFKHIVLVAGNHDFLFQKEPYLAQSMCHDAGIVYLEDRMVKLDGVRFLGSPWTPPFYNWAFMRPENQLLDLYHTFPQADVLITHGPAYGIYDQNDAGEHCGSMALKEALKWIRPRLHVFGHMHLPSEPARGMMVERAGFSYFAVNAAQVDDENQLRNWKKPVEIEI